MEDLERDISSKKHKSNPFLCKYVDLTTSDLSINQLDIYGANVQGVTSNLLVRAEIVGAQLDFLRVLASDVSRKFLVPTHNCSKPVVKSKLESKDEIWNEHASSNDQWARKVDASANPIVEFPPWLLSLCDSAADYSLKNLDQSYNGIPEGIQIKNVELNEEFSDPISASHFEQMIRSRTEWNKTSNRIHRDINQFNLDSKCNVAGFLRCIKPFRFAPVHVDDKTSSQLNRNEKSLGSCHSTEAPSAADEFLSNQMRDDMDDYSQASSSSYPNANAHEHEDTHGPSDPASGKAWQESNLRRIDSEEWPFNESAAEEFVDPPVDAADSCRLAVSGSARNMPASVGSISPAASDDCDEGAGFWLRHILQPTWVRRRRMIAPSEQGKQNKRAPAKKKIAGDVLNGVLKRISSATESRGVGTRPVASVAGISAAYKVQTKASRSTAIKSSGASRSLTHSSKDDCTAEPKPLYPTCDDYAAAARAHDALVKRLPAAALQKRLVPKLSSELLLEIPKSTKQGNAISASSCKKTAAILPATKRHQDDAQSGKLGVVESSKFYLHDIDLFLREHCSIPRAALSDNSSSSSSSSVSQAFRQACLRGQFASVASQPKQDHANTIELGNWPFASAIPQDANEAVLPNQISMGLGINLVGLLKSLRPSAGPAGPGGAGATGEAFDSCGPWGAHDDIWPAGDDLIFGGDMRVSEATGDFRIGGSGLFDELDATDGNSSFASDAVGYCQSFDVGSGLGFDREGNECEAVKGSLRAAGAELRREASLLRFAQNDDDYDYDHDDNCSGGGDDGDFAAFDLIDQNGREGAARMSLSDADADNADDADDDADVDVDDEMALAGLQADSPKGAPYAPSRQRDAFLRDQPADASASTDVLVSGAGLNDFSFNTTGVRAKSVVDPRNQEPCQLDSSGGGARRSLSVAVFGGLQSQDMKNLRDFGAARKALPIVVVQRLLRTVMKAPPHSSVIRLDKLTMPPKLSMLPRGNRDQVAVSAAGLLVGCKRAFIGLLFLADTYNKNAFKSATRVALLAADTATCKYAVEEAATITGKSGVVAKGKQIVGKEERKSRLIPDPKCFANSLQMIVGEVQQGLRGSSDSAMSRSMAVSISFVHVDA